MRTVTETIQAAIESVEGYRMYVRAYVEPSRVFFSALTADNAYEAGDYSAVTETPRPQAVVYSPTQAGAVTFITASNGTIRAMVQGSGTDNSVGVSTDSTCKVGVWDLGNGNAELWYWDSGVKKATVNMSSLSAGSPSSLSFSPSNWSVTKGSLHGVAAGEAVCTYLTSKGGMGAAYYDGSSWHIWSRRFMSPNRLINSGYWSVYSTAAKLGDKIFVYMTDLDRGEVIGVEYDILKDQWSDTFIALPADLSRFCVSNAIVANGYIHVSGHFHRTDDLAEAQRYSLVLRSSDGKTFSWDRFTLLSTLAYHFHIAIDPAGDKLYASDRNKVGTSTLSYYFAATPASRLTLQPPNDIVTFNSSDLQSATLQVKAADEVYFTHTLVRKNNRVKVELGYETALGPEYLPYMNYIISGVDENWQDGVRSLVLQLTAEGVWKINQIAFPFYSEIISKTSLHDDCDERDNLYPAPSSSKSTGTLVVDFWLNEGYENVSETITPHPFRTSSGAGCERKTMEGIYMNGFRTRRLSEAIDITDDPIIVDTTLRVKYYGWMATDDSARPNDTIYCKVVYDDPDGLEHEQDGVVFSSYAVLPQQYPDSEDGSYPVIFDFTNLVADSKLKYVAIWLHSTTATGSTTHAPERVEIIGTKFAWSGLNPSLTWPQTKPSGSESEDPTYLEVPGVGVPYVMFCTKPYTAFKFSINAEFLHEAGDHPATTGIVGWGCIGLAEDGSNYVGGRYNLSNQRLEIFKVREGADTVLDYVDDATERVNLMLEHRDGQIMLFYRSGEVWAMATSYHWDEVSEGVMATSDTDIMHVGVYGTKKTPGFRIPSFNASDGDGIGMIPAWGSSDVGAFPESGVVVIDNILYSFTGKTGTAWWYGPFQARNTGNYGSYGTYFYGMACEVAHYAPATNILLVANYLLCSDNGHSWKLRATDWNVTHYNAGEANHLRNRCRHFGDNINGNWVGINNRMFVVPGLTGIDRLSAGEAVTHPYGSWCFMAASNKIWLKRVVATTADTDATVKDMTRMLCQVASVPATFPGDWTSASLEISGTPTEIATTKEKLPGGYDLTFTMPALGSNEWVALYGSNVKIGYSTPVDFINLGFRNSGGTLQAFADPDGTTFPAEYRNTPFSPGVSHVVRILQHDNFASLYVDGVWAATFGWGKDHIFWPQTEAVHLYLHASGSKTLTNLLLTELFDWREAIYMESEMSAQSALSSVIQERPVEVYPTSTGGLSFSYRLVRDTITYDATISKKVIHNVRKKHSTSSDSGSDAVVYYDKVGFVSNSQFASEEGFLTRVYKLSGLSSGAEAAAKILLEKAVERQHMCSIEMRVDARIEPGDILALTLLVSGTGTTISGNYITEGVSLRIMEGNYAMSIDARQDL